MRVRIAKPLTGVIDGVPLSSLVSGFVYEFSAELATHLVEIHAAVPARSTDPPTEAAGEDVDLAWFTGGVHVLQHDTADERSRRRRRTRRRLKE